MVKEKMEKVRFSFEDLEVWQKAIVFQQRRRLFLFSSQSYAKILCGR